MWLICITFAISALTCYIFYTLFKSNDNDGGNIDSFISATKLDGPKFAETSVQNYNRRYQVAGWQILILYGTEYGFSEEVARYIFDKFDADLPSSGVPWQPRILNAKYFTHVDLSKEQILLVVISTAGDGVAPSEARPFVNEILTSHARYPHLSFAVLSLGDSNYPHFCRAGRTLNQRLLEIAGEELIARQDVDTEDWSVINAWLNRLLILIPQLRLEERFDYLQLLPRTEEEGHSRTWPFMATLKHKSTLTKLSKYKDEKETIECELCLRQSGLTWIAGDALGIYPQNCPQAVQQLLDAMHCNGDEMTEVPKWAYDPKPASTIKLRDALSRYYDLKYVKVELLEMLKNVGRTSIESDELDRLLQTGVHMTRQNRKLQEYIEEHEVVDVLESQPVAVSRMDYSGLLKQLRPLQPRYYSISSSPLKEETTVRVTAAVIRYTTSGQPRIGVTTTYLQDRLSVGNMCAVFISSNPHFRLPSDTASDIIMIGPGTGLAPFMAFMQERVLKQATGRNRLYFGCRHQSQDYIYQDQLEKWQTDGALELRVAFSRDQPQKRYVQHLLAEDAHTLWPMMRDERTHVYVCGDARSMAPDVHAALVNIAMKHGAMSAGKADEFLAEMESENRYQKDVWIT